MTFGKHSPDQLWSRAASTAELQSNRGDEGAYVHGYFAAAAHLAHAMVANEVPVDTVAYPALFLFRHGIEIGFKALLRGYSFELRSDPPLGRSGHSLATLWQQLRPLIAADDFLIDSLEPGRCSQSVTLEDVEALVRSLDAIDPRGEAARYDVTLDGKFTMAQVNRINLEALLEICLLIEDWMMSHLYARDELVSHLRLQRWEREKQ